MISIIICSANAEDLRKVKYNISETIGVPHEIIAINNADGRKGICEVYNDGAKQAKFETLCFMHEDIEMKTQDWGEKILNLFSANFHIGLIGIAGGGYKSVTPSGWYNYDLEENGGAYSNVLQGYKRDKKDERLDYNNPKNESYSKVACLDGCWLCIRKSVWKEFPFDEKMLKRFHGYDLDISLAVNQKYQVIVTFDVFLRHFSEGNYDQAWLEEMFKVHKKWNHILPFNADHLIEGDLVNNEKRAFRRYLQNSVNAGIPLFTLFKVTWNARHSRVIGFNMMLKLCFALLKMRPKKSNLHIL